MERIRGTWEKDSHLQVVIQQLKRGQIVKHYSWFQDQLKRKRKFVVGKDDKIRREILQHYHDSALGGHSGINATYRRISGVFYWKILWKYVRELVRTCRIYQIHKPKLVVSPGLLQPLLIPQTNFSDILQTLLRDFQDLMGRML